MKKIFLLFILAFQNSFLSAQEKPIIIGYVGGYNGNIVNADQVDARRLTHINYAFVNIKDNLAYLENEKTDTVNFKNLNKLKTINPDLKILISIGGWTWSKNFSDAVLTKTSRKNFAKSAVDIVKNHDLDGVDIDWEYPGMIGDNNKFRPVDKQNYTLMFKELRKQLDKLGKKTKKNYLVTTAIGGSREFLQNTEMHKVQKYTDFINMMSYDFDGTYPEISSHHTNLYASGGLDYIYSTDITLQNLMAAGVPPHKVVMGVAFYGKGKIVENADNNGLYAKAVRPMFGGGYTRLKEGMVNQNGFVRYWDEEAQAPYLFNAETKTFITYDDEESIAAKCDYILKYNLRGVMFWEYFSDPKLYLLKTINEKLGYEID